MARDKLDDRQGRRPAFCLEYQAKIHNLPITLGKFSEEVGSAKQKVALAGCQKRHSMRESTSITRLERMLPATSIAQAFAGELVDHGEALAPAPGISAPTRERPSTPRAR